MEVLLFNWMRYSRGKIDKKNSIILNVVPTEQMMFKDVFQKGTTYGWSKWLIHGNIHR